MSAASCAPRPSSANGPSRKPFSKERALGKGAALRKGAALPDEIARLLAPSVAFERLHLSGGCLWSLPEGIEPERLSGLRVLRTGLLLAREAGKRFGPDHALAMALSPDQAARSFALTHDQALSFQAGEALALEGSLPEGYTLLCLCGVPLGWGKQAGGLMKNHYPKGLRRRPAGG